MNIESWPIGRPTPYPQNARKISDAAVDKVAASIREFGWRQPIVVDTEGVIIVGHARLLAAKRMGAETVPVHVATDLTATQVRAYRLMDNRSHDETEWDAALLGAELLDLSALDLDMSLTGFDGDELAELLAQKTTGLSLEDEVPVAPVAPATRPGDLWLLGEHRLLCGNSTQAADVHRALGGRLSPLMVTDPPYGVDYDPTWRDGKGASRPPPSSSVARF